MKLILPFFLLVAFNLWGAKKNAQPVVGKPFPPLEAAKTMQVPKGFNVTLFAGEPDIKQPIGFCIDDRGRLWVAEANNYPDKKAGKNDRIIILEDTNGDGNVNVSDILAAIGNWGGSGDGDVDGSGVVDVSDLLAIVGAWGPC